MKFQAITGNFNQAGAQALAVPVFKGEKPSDGLLKTLDKMTGGLVAGVFKNEGFKGEGGQIAFIRFVPKGKTKASCLLLVGVGDASDYKIYSIAQFAGTVAIPAEAQHSERRRAAARKGYRCGSRYGVGARVYHEPVRT